MKNKKEISKYVSIINVILIVIIINLLIGKNIIVGKEKQVIKEMTQSENEANLQIQIDALNVAHEEYASNVQKYKKQIADAITSQGVSTSENDTGEVMAENIGRILTTSGGMTITGIKFYGKINEDEDSGGAQTASAYGEMTFDVSKYSTVTFGTISKQQTGTYDNSRLSVKLNNTSVSVSSGTVLDVSGSTTMYLKAEPSIYGNAGSTRTGTVTVSSITFK